MAHHPQIAQGKQRLQLLRVLHQATVAHLHVAELALDDADTRQWTRVAIAPVPAREWKGPRP